MDITFQLNIDSPKEAPNKTTYKLMKCTDAIPNHESLFNNVEGFDKTLFEENWLCFNNSELENLVLEGRDGLSALTTNSSVVSGSLLVQPCDSSASTNPDFCIGNEADLRDVQLYLGFIEAKLDLEDYDKPVSFYMNWDKWFFINPTFYNYYALDVVVNTVRDDRGAPLSDVIKANFTSLTALSNTQAPIDKEDRKLACGKSEECPFYLHVQFFSSLTAVENLRVYKPITDVLGTIGGVKQILFLVFSYLHLLFTQGLKEKFVVEKVFGIVPDSTQVLCCKKKKGVIGEKNSRGSFFVPRDIVAKAYKTILSSVDITTLTHELFILRFLSSALLRDYQLNLMPLIALNHFTSEKDDDPDEPTQTTVTPTQPSPNQNDPKTDLQSPESDPERGPFKEFDLHLPPTVQKQLLRFIENYNSKSKDIIPKVEQSWNKIQQQVRSKNQIPQQNEEPKSLNKIHDNPTPTTRGPIFEEQLDFYLTKKIFQMLDGARFNFLSKKARKTATPAGTNYVPADLTQPQVILTEQVPSFNKYRIADANDSSRGVNATSPPNHRLPLFQSAAHS